MKIRNYGTIRCILIIVLAITGLIGLFDWYLRNLVPTGSDVSLWINFKNSSCSVNLHQRWTDYWTSINVYKDSISTQRFNFGNLRGEFYAIQDGYRLESEGTLLIYIHVDDEGFASAHFRMNASWGVDHLCLDLDPDNVNWYGGPQFDDVKYPIQTFNFSTFPVVTAEHHKLVERYWLTSNGFFFHMDYDSPAIMIYRPRHTTYPERDQFCFYVDNILPYYAHDDNFSFGFKFGYGKDSRKTHTNVINHIVGKPHGVPNHLMIRYPIWSTKVRYHKREVNESLISNFAEEIIIHNFKRSMLDIGEFWEECFGSFVLDKTKYPNMKALSERLNNYGFTPALWVHPFINTNCEEIYNEANDKKYLVTSHSGNILTSWANSEINESTHVDFTNPEASDWFRNRLMIFQRNHGIATFHFYGGESGFQPQDPLLHGDKLLSPSLTTLGYLNVSRTFGDQVIVSTGWGTQFSPNWIQMPEFQSKWTGIYSLETLIPRLLQYNINGYGFVMPGAIGGNATPADGLTKELFIRWLQATVFMASLKFSVTPWDFDQETIEICRKFAQLHETYGDLILNRFNLAVTNGEPVNPPIWWLDPEDKEAQIINNEFLLGDNILAAPVIEKGANQRDIYLPIGTWEDGNTGKMYEGRQWVRRYAAPIDVLPYFIRH